MVDVIQAIGEALVMFWNSSAEHDSPFPNLTNGFLTWQQVILGMVGLTLIFGFIYAFIGIGNEDDYGDDEE